MDRPDRLFRYFRPVQYRALNRFFPHEELFGKRRLWTSRVDSFNDPFDMAPRYDWFVETIRQEAVKKVFVFDTPPNGPTWPDFTRITQPGRDQLSPIMAEVLVEKMQHRFSDDLGVICFSRKFDNLLMWSHYADGHRGFVVEFDPNHSIFSSTDFGHVHYVQERPSVRVGGGPTELKALVLAKHEDWGYESEWRLMIPNNRLQPVREGDQTHYFLPLPEDAVKAVFLGCAMEPELGSALVVSLRGYGGGRTPVSVMVRAPDDYRLDTMTFDEWAAQKARSDALRADF